MRKLIVMAAFAALLVGCQKESEEVELSPLEKMKSHLAEVDGKRSRVFGREWKNISYDVQKTDSLVSPYTATVSAEVHRFDDETETEPSDRYDYKITMLYQDDRWVVKQVSMNYLGIPGLEELSQDGIQELTKDDIYYEMVSKELNLK